MAYHGMAVLRVPPDFWDRPGVAEAAQARDFAALFLLVRRWTGASQTMIGTACGLTQGYVSRIMTGAARPSHLHIIARIADGLAMPDHLRAALGLAPAGPAPGSVEDAAVKDRVDAWRGRAAATTTVLRLPLDFWSSRDVIAAVRTRDSHGVLQAVQGAGAGIPAIAVATGIDPTYVGRIVRGERRPSRIDLMLKIADGLGMPEHLRAIFLGHRTGPLGLPEDGVTPDDASPSADSADRSDVSERELQEMNRRSFLRMLSATSALALVSAPDDIDTERLTSGATDPEALADYEALNAHLWRVFAASPSKPAILPFVQAQLNVLTSALQGRLSSKTHRHTCALLGDLYQLGGEAFFDAENYVDAGHCYTLAASLAKEADAFDLWACAMTRHAFINVYERRFNAALPLLERAKHLAGRGDTSLSTRHWVQAVTAQTHAGLGRLDDCERAISLASEVNDLSGPVHNGGWLRFDGARLSEERGACYVELERPDLAEPALLQSLAGDLSHRRRGTILADLAIVAAQRGDMTRWLDYATDALDVAVHTGSGVVRRQLAQVQSNLYRLPSSRRVHQLRQQIASLKSGQH